ncbi:MAG TPA: cytochrome c biogenesis protein CcsA [Vicinamibacterales bacterium]|nr:cytochrome c biogenesis protein CcsA [Vicinamibacterales bacterium]
MTRVVPFLLVIAALMFMRAPFMIDAAPYESTMGLVQKIFYFHVPAAITTFLSVFVCGIASAIFLVRRKRMADHVAVAAAELAVLFGLMVIVTGPLWARKAWGVWWTWGDARLVMTFVMWMVFVAYLLLRKFGGPGSEVLAAAAGIFGMVLVPFVYWSVNYWRTVHPSTDVIRTLPPEMSSVLSWCIYSFFVLYAALLLLRTQLESHRASLDEAFLALED